MSEDFTDEQMALIRKVKSKITITKVVATRAVKHRNGDAFVGFAASWDSIQEDGGGSAADLADVLEEGETQTAYSQRSMTMKEGKVAALLLGMQADLSALENAAAGNVISAAKLAERQNAIKVNYLQLLDAATKNGNGNGEG